MIITWRRLFFVGLAILWMAFVFFVSSRPDPLALLPWNTPPGPAGTATQSPLFPAMFHFTEYFVLASLLHGAFGSRRAGTRVYLATLGMALAFALSDEIHQRYTPNRDSSLGDIGVDAAGIVAALLCWKLAEATRPIRPRGPT